MDEAGWSSAQKLLLAAGFQKQPVDVAKAFTTQDAMNAIVLTDRLDAAPITPTKPVLSIAGLNVRFGSVVAIESLTLTVRRGEFVSLLGPSGCGKSTLLKAIADLVKPTGGRITRSDVGLRTGFMFQKPLLLPWRTTLDNVLLPIEIQRGGNTVDAVERQNALRMLDLVRLKIPKLRRRTFETAII
jgi:ABC-type Fe3+/spermidine/putrescine transport system ATPase subunit